MSTLRRLLDLLTPGERRRAALLLGMILIMALLDVIGVASIMPFIGVLANPEIIESNAFIGTVYNTLGFTDAGSFLLFLGAVMLVALVVSIAFKALTTYVQLRFVCMREHSIGRRLVEGYLHQPYVWFLNHHSADLGKTILSEVAQVINNAMMPMMVAITQGAVALALLVLLVVVNPWIALGIGGVLGLSYGLIYVSVRGYLARFGVERLQANHGRFAALSEAFGGIKEVKVAGLEEPYIERFDKAAECFASRQAASLAIGQLPRFALEAVAFGGLMLVVLLLLARTGGINDEMPIIALYAFAGYRLMPALQQVYGSFTQLRFAGPALQALHVDLRDLPLRAADGLESEPLDLQRGITLRDVQYTYPNTSQTAVSELSVTIPTRSTVGFVGATGSGKTTVVDIILGLLEPDRGELLIDEIPITAGNRRRWQHSIGYVPQQIFLADDTVVANIAFGVSPDRVDQGAVERAAGIANLHDFVKNELPQGYATRVGERGVRLSGGQRQRIGIARALYHRPRVLILDEATSALDSLTEHAVMEAVNALSQEVIIILIAHRLSTVRQCDQIFLMRGGRLVATGTYDELAEDNDIFRAMAVR